MKLGELRGLGILGGRRLACMCALLPLSGLAATTYYVDNKLDDYTGHDGSSWALAHFPASSRMSVSRGLRKRMS